MRAHVIDWTKCVCGLTRATQHPIQHCWSCEREAYEAAFTKLRAEAAYTHLLGVDPYMDAIYVHGDGVTLSIEGRADRMLRMNKADELVRRITELEAENRDVLAENARMRRRLESTQRHSVAEEKKR